MNADQIKTISVLGAGVMGHGIAQLCALQGFDVRLYDIKEEFVRGGFENIRKNLGVSVEKQKLSEAEKDAALSRVSTCTTLKDAVNGAQAVIEAAPEKPELKAEIFKTLGELCGPNVLLATNTSSLSVTAIAKSPKHPQRVIGMHFFNPPYIMKLLEIVKAEQTSDEALICAKALGSKLGRDVIVVRDSPGFATSRLGVALGLEAIRMLESGVASAEDIDKAMELGYRHPMGPLKLTDVVGLDTRLNIANYLHESLGSETFRPPKLMMDMVAQGKLGKKSGQGFYSW